MSNLKIINYKRFSLEYPKWLPYILVRLYVWWIGARILETVAITFDDGYEDNLTNASPIIEHFKVPVTIFVTAMYASHLKLPFGSTSTKVEQR